MHSHPLVNGTHRALASPPAAATSEALLLTYEQAAEQLQLGARTVRRLVERGELPAVRYGRAVRIDRRDLIAWIDAQKRADGPARDADVGA